MTKEELNKILENHKKWLNSEKNGIHFFATKQEAKEY